MPPHWRFVVVAYLLWLMLFAVCEGFGREACRLPTRRWIDAATDARDRVMRDELRQRAASCLEQTRWYAEGMRALVLAALVLPLAALWIARRERELVRGFVLVGALGVTLGSMAAVRWLYDWMA